VISSGKSAKPGTFFAVRRRLSSPARLGRAKVHLHNDPKPNLARTYKGVASFSDRRVSLCRGEERAPRARLDREEAHWYRSALVNGDSDSGARAPESDEALVRAIANGDTRALAALYDRHAPLMLALTRRIVVGKSEAEDIVHDVFVEAWRRAADYDSTRGSVKAWLLLRTRSRAIDFRKSAGVARTVPTGDADWLAALADPRALDAEAPDLARLRQLLAMLNEDQRQVLFLGYFEGLSSSEIAARLSIPIGTVKSRVAAALGALRQALADQPRERR